MESPPLFVWTHYTPGLIVITFFHTHAGQAHLYTWFPYP